MEILQYILFGYSFIVLFLLVILSDGLIIPKIFNRFLKASILALVLGIVCEITCTFDILEGFTFATMSAPIIFLSYFIILRKLFLLWKGTEPYLVGKGESIGDKVMNGFMTKYPRNRKIMWSDLLFSLLFLVLPLATIFACGLFVEYIWKYFVG